MNRIDPAGAVATDLGRAGTGATRVTGETVLGATDAANACTDAVTEGVAVADAPGGFAALTLRAVDVGARCARNP